MLPIHQQDPDGCRPRGVRTDIDLALERAGSAWERTADEREAFATVARLLGCDVAADHIEGAHRRRQLVHAAPDPAPRPGPKPRPTPATPPLLWVVPAETVDEQRDVSIDDQMFEALATFARRWRGRGLAPYSVTMLDVFQAAATDALQPPSQRQGTPAPLPPEPA